METNETTATTQPPPHTGFFEESPNNFSMTRLLVFALVVYGILGSSAVTICGLVKYLSSNGTTGGETLGAIVLAAGGFLSAITTFAGGWKLMQKQQEG